MEFLGSQIVTLHWKRALLVIIGAAAGYTSYATIGCLSGACPITGNPWVSTAYGGLIGFLLSPSERRNRSLQEKETFQTDNTERSE